MTNYADSEDIQIQQENIEKVAQRKNAKLYISKIQQK